MNDQGWNFLIITTDEERYPTCYDPSQVREYLGNLPGVKALRQNSLEFHRHYAASTACSPSRTSIYTGQYPSLHGVSQTSGLGKAWFDPNMFYLDPNTVPTMGDYFRAGGYRTFYRGKWHLSHPDIGVPGTHNILLSTTNDGSPIPRAIELYKTANKLGPYGFDGWIGPDPHGAAQANMGINRDPGFANQTTALLEALDNDPSDQPWLTVASFTNPHDIVFFGTPWLSFGYDYDFPAEVRALGTPLPPTRFEDLTSKPACQADYAKKYGEMFFRNPTIGKYFQLYYYLQSVVDQEILKVYECLKRTRFYENTIVIYTSDHGDLLGAHGGMHQKWYNAYEETLHVPFIVSNPQLYEGQKHSQALASHVDLLPTMLGLAGIVEKDAAKTIAVDHSEVHDLVGHNLAEQVLSGGTDGRGDKALYFMTDDEVSEGLSDTNPRGNPYQSVNEPAHVETVITRLADEEGCEKIWKYSRYYSNPRFWGDNPGNPDQPQLQETEGGPAEHELYCLTDDPTEISNLTYGMENLQANKETIAKLQGMMTAQRALKRKLPKNWGSG